MNATKVWATGSLTKEDAPLPICEIRVIRGKKYSIGRLGESQCLLLGVALPVFIIGAAAFQVRDIKA